MQAQFGQRGLPRDGSAPAGSTNWKELWLALSRRIDGGPRPVPDRAEGMLVSLRDTPASPAEAERAEIAGDTLRLFHADVLRIESSAAFRSEPKERVGALYEAWFAFRQSRQGWIDLERAVRSASFSRALVTAVAHELWEERGRYLDDLSSSDDPRTLGAARRITLYLSRSFSQLSGDPAAALADAARSLFVRGRITDAEYVQRLWSYVKSPGATVQECGRQLLLAERALPKALSREAELDLVQLGQTLGAMLHYLDGGECEQLLRAPLPVVLGMSQAFMCSRLTQEPLQEGALAALQKLGERLTGAKAALHASTRARHPLGPSVEVVELLRALHPEDGAAALRALAPLVAQANWWGRESQGLWELLSSDSREEQPARRALMRIILESPELTDSVAHWSAQQSGHPAFRYRCDAVTDELRCVLRERFRAGEAGMPEAVVLSALQVLAEVGASSVRAAPEVASLLGRTVVNVWAFGPLFVPFHARADSSPAVVEASRYALHVIAAHAPPSFRNAVTSRGL